MASFNEFMQGITKGVGDVVDNITHSEFYKNVIPTRDGFGQELSKVIGSNQKIDISQTPNLQSMLDNVIISGARRPLFRAGLDDDTIKNVSEQMANALRNTDYSNEDIGKLAEIMKKHNVEDRMIEVFSNNASSEIQRILKKSNISVHVEKPTLKQGLHHPLLYAKTYFNNPDPKIKQQRITAVAGTYGTLAVGGRLLSGGTITEDNYGRRDIAGIPFI